MVRLLGLCAVVAGLALAADAPVRPPQPGSGAPTPLAMVPATHPSGACADCHADPHQPAVDSPRACDTCHVAEGWRPSLFTVELHAATAFPLADAHATVPCTQCHTSGRLTGLPGDCAGCHVDRHRGKLGSECATCHTTVAFTPVQGFDHALTGFVVDGSHTGLDCAACHKGANGDAMRLVATATCGTCHGEAHATFDQPCGACHQTTQATFAAALFDHRPTGFDLERRHKVQPCAACHPVGQDHAPSDRCAECHVDPHSHQLGIRCDDCHRPDRWSVARFDHDQTGWALRGRHFVTPCAECHTAQRWVGLTTACADCHAQDAAIAPASVPAHRWIRSTCSDCHGTWTWR